MPADSIRFGRLDQILLVILYNAEYINQWLWQNIVLRIST